MRIAIVLLITFFSVQSFAQGNKTTVKVKDSVTAAQVEVTDSTLIFSVSDLKPLYDKIQELPYKEAAPFINYLNSLVTDRAARYRIKKAESLNKKQ